MAMLGLACFGWVWLALLLVGYGEGSGFSAGTPRFGGSRPHDVGSRSGLTSLYNERVVSFDHVTRPLSGSGSGFGPFHHAGVRVTTESGGQYLIHKGDGFGGSGGDTVVTDAKHMSNKWTTQGTYNAKSGSTVSDFVKAGGTDYSLLSNNCQHAANRMVNNNKQ